MIILEFAARGDLRQYLIDHRPKHDQEALLTTFDMAQIAVDIANGMVFLSSKNFVHRDLAARFELGFMLLLAQYRQKLPGCCERHSEGG
jgi:serine/threonine protein kinase